MIGPTLEVRRGNARTLYIDVQFPPAPFPVQDLNNFTKITFTVKRDEDDPDAQKVLQKTKGAGITVSTPTRLAIAIGPNELNEKGKFVWDVEVQSPQTTLISGYLVVLPVVTITAP